MLNLLQELGQARWCWCRRLARWRFGIKKSESSTSLSLVNGLVEHEYRPVPTDVCCFIFTFLGVLCIFIHYGQCAGIIKLLLWYVFSAVLVYSVVIRDCRPNLSASVELLAWKYSSKCCNDGRGLRQRHNISSKTTRSPDLLQWAIGLQQQQQRRRQFVLKTEMTTRLGM